MMRGNDSSPLDSHDDAGSRQFVDLPLFTDIEPEEEELESADPEHDETGPVRAEPGSTESGEVDAAEFEEPYDLPSPEAVQEELVLPDDDLDEDHHPAITLDEERPEGPATLTNRLGAALLDLTVMASAAAALLGGAALLGAGMTIAHWPAFVIPWLAFSFLYHVVPLAFWGRTPGMASMGITARHLDGGSLSFTQATWRWIATMVTSLLLGLPGLLALTGRSVTDRASESVTVWRG